MNRNDFSIICRLLKELRRPEESYIPTIPGGEWMRQRIGCALIEAFNLTGDAKVAFERSAGLPPR